MFAVENVEAQPERRKVRYTIHFIPSEMQELKLRARHMDMSRAKYLREMAFRQDMEQVGRAAFLRAVREWIRQLDTDGDRCSWPSVCGRH